MTDELPLEDQCLSLADELERRRQASEILDQQAEHSVLQVAESVGRAEQKLSQMSQGESIEIGIRPGSGADAEAIGSNTTTADDSGDVQRQSDDGTSRGVPEVSRSDDADGECMLDDNVGSNATMRYQAARLGVLQEEVDKLRSMVAEKSEAAVQAERSASDEQQQRIKHERAEKQLRAALERERSLLAEQRARTESVERELLAVRKEGDEANRSNQAALAEQRTKEVRLNRALEELERSSKHTHHLLLLQPSSASPTLKPEQLLSSSSPTSKPKRTPP